MGHHNRDVVHFPDGTTVMGSSFQEPDADDNPPEFGLYLYERWCPTWEAEFIEWIDFGLPSDGTAAAGAIRSAFLRAKSGQRVEVACNGGHGRTGTVLACMGVLAGLDPHEAVAHVRRHYCASAVETSEQEEWVAWFSTWLMKQE